MIDEKDRDTMDILDHLADQFASDRDMDLATAGECLKQGILRLSELCRKAGIPVDDDTAMHMTRMVAGLRYLSRRAEEESKQ